jgi:predicted lipoprotein with Yx(FWY)xxD motif
MIRIERWAAVAAVALALGACAMSDGCATANAPAVTRDTAIGPVLTDPHGMTLYTLSNDEGGKSSCSGKCARLWPPYLAPAGAQPAGKWSLTARGDGTQQWAYAGKPLYFWTKDKQPGDVTGDKYGDVWWAARP